MKYRTDFVSNSSSCSFCVLGYECPDTIKKDVLSILGHDISKLDEFEIDDLCWDFIHNQDVEILDKDHGALSGIVIGVPVVKSLEEGLDENSISLEDALTKLDDLRQKLSSIPNLDLVPKIISGTYAC